MDTVRFIHGGPELLDAVVTLWTQLNAHHARIRPDFADWFGNRTFSDRKAELRVHGSAGIRVCLAMADDATIGYCVSTISGHGTGELDSIYVTPDHRGRGIGARLIGDALIWLETHNIERISVTVVYGNDAALALYRRFGFAPRLTTMLRIQDRTQQISP